MLALEASAQNWLLGPNKLPRAAVLKLGLTIWSLGEILKVLAVTLCQLHQKLWVRPRHLQFVKLPRGFQCVYQSLRTCLGGWFLPRCTLHSPGSFKPFHIQVVPTINYTRTSQQTLEFPRWLKWKPGLETTSLRGFGNSPKGCDSWAQLT